jgi:hypothetical protein
MARHMAMGRERNGRDAHEVRSGFQRGCSVWPVRKRRVSRRDGPVSTDQREALCNRVNAKRATAVVTGAE